MNSSYAAANNEPDEHFNKVSGRTIESDESGEDKNEDHDEGPVIKVFEHMNYIFILNFTQGGEKERNEGGKRVIQPGNE